MKLMMVAGEASGDAHGTGMLKELACQIKGLEVFGVGGPGMVKAGLRPYFLADELQVHGMTELLRHLPRLYRKLWLLRDALKEEQPDAVILIDYPGFNLKLARYAQDFRIPVIFFNSGSS